ncbi:hypothetical protein ACFL1H_05435 [Nanoarchaeota archaeon]
MVVPELAKLGKDDREEFYNLHRTLPHEMTKAQGKRYKHFLTIIDTHQLFFEQQRDQAKDLKEDTWLRITQKSPYKLSYTYGEVTLPSELVPEELNIIPGDDYRNDWIRADVAADLDTMTITEFNFITYVKHSTQEEIDAIPGIDSLPEGSWPRNE